MRAFREGTTQIMVATSVIEVGVDVPNATVMVIESAERFGLSQLHQLRGRVGRGGEQSYCILMSGDRLSREARARLDAMVETNDGFRLSELDLKLRGAGDIGGTQQSGTAFELIAGQRCGGGGVCAACGGRDIGCRPFADPAGECPAGQAEGTVREPGRDGFRDDFVICRFRRYGYMRENAILCFD